jgi:hypothetical protein
MNSNHRIHKLNKDTLEYVSWQDEPNQPLQLHMAEKHKVGGNTKKYKKDND